MIRRAWEQHDKMVKLLTDEGVTENVASAIVKLILTAEPLEYRYYLNGPRP